MDNLKELENKIVIAKTENSIVYDGLTSIFKLTKEPASYFFMLENMESLNPYFPKIYKDYGLVYNKEMEKYWLIEMEKLNPLNQYDNAYLLSMSLIESYEKYWKEWANLGNFFWSLPWKIAQNSIYENDLKEALVKISDFSEEMGVFPDLLKKDNYMKRDDGHLVIIDPVFSKKLDK